MADAKIKFKVFGKSGCEICRRVHEKMEYFRSRWLNEATVDYYDMATVDGLAEGAFNDVMDIPTVLLEKDGEIVSRWDKTAPTFEELRSIFPISEKNRDGSETTK